MDVRVGEIASAALRLPDLQGQGYECREDYAEGDEEAAAAVVQFVE